MRPSLSVLLTSLCLISLFDVSFGRLFASDTPAIEPNSKPNVVYIIADQWRAQATGYAGDTNVKTPHLDALAERSINFATAVSTCPVCTPHRGSLMTGQYPLTHGAFINDVPLTVNGTSLAKAFVAAGYTTGYIGKWHMNGGGRSAYIPPDRRLGFEFWRVLECTHNYNDSPFYGDTQTKQRWQGYDAKDQADEAQRYIKAHAKQGPFLLILAWGPPHDPYGTAPKKYRDMYDAEKIIMRPNVPAERYKKIRAEIAGYYAHCTALDSYLGMIRDTLQQTGIDKNTILVFSSDHGDMLGSQNKEKKQLPFDESIRVPFLLHWPQLTETKRTITTPIGTPDIMPTLLGLSGIPIPDGVEGLNFAPYLRGGPVPGDGAALIACYALFGNYIAAKGGIEYRGIRTERYTWVRNLKGPWLLYDNQSDPYQLKNLCDDPASAPLRAELDTVLNAKLSSTHDTFEPGSVYVKRWNYSVKPDGTMPYTP